MRALFNKFMVVLSIGLFFSTAAVAQISSPVSNQSESQAPYSALQENISNIPIALDGHDVVNYFYSSVPEKGDGTYQAVYKGQRYLFISPENQEKFAAGPEQYLPEFEEYCACAVSDNKRVQADPRVFKITNGRLVLFGDEEARSKWEKNEQKRYQAAQKFWKYETEYNAEDRLHDDTRVRLFTF